MVALRAKAAVAAFRAWETVRLRRPWEHEVCCVWEPRHLPAARRQDAMAAAGVEVSAPLLVGSELACGTRPLRSCRARSASARTNIANSVKRFERIGLATTLIARWAEAGFAPGHAIALAAVGDRTSPALLLLHIG